MDSVAVGMGAAEMETEATVAHRVELKPKALEVDSLSGNHVLIVRLCVGQLGFVEVQAGFRKNDPFFSYVEADAVDGSDILSEELGLFERGAVDDVKIHLHPVELQFVTQSDVVDELARLVLNHVDRVGGLKRAHVAVPHQVVGVDALHGCVGEGRIAKLEKHLVVAGFVGEVQRGAHLVAAYGIPELGAIIDVDRVGVVLPAADGHDLLACREEQVISEMPVEISPVRSLKKGVGEVDVRGVETLAQVVGELGADSAVQGDDQIFSSKPMVRGGTHSVVPKVIIKSIVGARVEIQLIQSDERLLVLRIDL